MSDGEGSDLGTRHLSQIVLRSRFLQQKHGTWCFLRSRLFSSFWPALIRDRDDDHDDEDDQQTRNSRRSKPKYSPFDIQFNTMFYSLRWIPFLITKNLMSIASNSGSLLGLPSFWTMLRNRRANIDAS